MKKTLMSNVGMIVIILVTAILASRAVANLTPPQVHIVEEIKIPIAERSAVKFWSVNNVAVERVIYQSQTSEHNLAIVKVDQQLSGHDSEILCLAKNIFYEAGIESEIGKFAVAQVTLNRIADERYPDTICDVVMQPYQFSWTNNKSLKWSKPQGINWDASVRVAKQVIFSGKRVVGLEGVVHYHADYVNPVWSRGATPIAKIGQHVFFYNIQ